MVLFFRLRWFAVGSAPGRTFEQAHDLRGNSLELSVCNPVDQVGGEKRLSKMTMPPFAAALIFPIGVAPCHPQVC